MLRFFIERLQSTHLKNLPLALDVSFLHRKEDMKKADGVTASVKLFESDGASACADRLFGQY